MNHASHKKDLRCVDSKTVTAESDKVKKNNLRVAKGLKESVETVEELT